MLDAPSQRASARQSPPPSGPSVHGDKPARLLDAARDLLGSLSRGRALTAGVLRDAMTAAFGATDTDGAWVWKDAYDAAEAAVVLFVKRYGAAMRREAGAGPQGPAAMLDMLRRLSALEPSHTGSTRALCYSSPSGGSPTHVTSRSCGRRPPSNGHRDQPRHRRATEPGGCMRYTFLPAGCMPRTLVTRSRPAMRWVARSGAGPSRTWYRSPTSEDSWWRPCPWGLSPPFEYFLCAFSA